MRVRLAVSTLLLTAAAAAAVTVTPGEPSSPQYVRGATVYAETCVVCHGTDGRGGQGYAFPTWGHDAKLGDKFASAQQLHEYLRVLMPFDDPARVSDDDKWAVIHFMLSNGRIIPRSKDVGPQNAATIKLTDGRHEAGAGARSDRGEPVLTKKTIRFVWKCETGTSDPCSRGPGAVDPS